MKTAIVCLLLAFSAQITAIHNRIDGRHAVFHRAVAMGLLELAPLGDGLITNLFAQLDHGVENRLWTRRAAGQIEINWDKFVDPTNSRRGIGAEHATRDGAGPHGDDVFGFRHLLIESHQSRGHLHSDRASHDQKISLPRTRPWDQAKTIEIKTGADQRSKFNEAASRAIEQRPEAAEAGPVMEIVEAGQDDVLREITGDLRGSDGPATGCAQVAQGIKRGV